MAKKERRDFDFSELSDDLGKKKPSHQRDSESELDSPAKPERNLAELSDDLEIPKPGAKASGSKDAFDLNERPPVKTPPIQKQPPKQKEGFDAGSFRGIVASEELSDEMPEVRHPKKTPEPDISDRKVPDELTEDMGAAKKKVEPAGRELKGKEFTEDLTPPAHNSRRGSRSARC